MLDTDNYNVALKTIKKLRNKFLFDWGYEFYKIIKASGKKLTVEHDLSQPTIKTSLCLDCSKAQRELKWKPRVGLEDGILQTIKWYKKNLHS